MCYQLLDNMAEHLGRGCQIASWTTDRGALHRAPEPFRGPGRDRRPRKPRPRSQLRTYEGAAAFREPGAGDASRRRSPKTASDLALVDLGNILCSADARLPSLLVQEAIEQGRLPQFSGYNEIVRESHLRRKPARPAAQGSALHLLHRDQIGDPCGRRGRSVP